MSYSIELERKFELRNPVTPYVCSTPADFEDERDWLADHVFPKLAELCVTRGTYFSPVDVRWSPQDPLSQEGHLLHSLLDLVNKSSPYFLCLLGECYGPYQPTASSLSNNVLLGTSTDSNDWLELNLTTAAECGHPWVLQDGHQYCSISELEIMDGCLRGQSNQCTFYFRQAEHLDQKFSDLSNEERLERSSKFMSESDHAGLKVQSLKQTVVKHGLPVRYFKTLQELGDIVLEDWVAILDTVCPPLYNNGSFLDTEHYQLWVSREALLTRLRKDFVPSEDTEMIMDILSQFVLTAIDEQPQENHFKPTEMPKSVADIFRQKPPPPPPYQTIMLLNGDRGVGKSALLAQWLQEFADENPGLFLIHHFIGAAPGDNDITAFLRRCTRDLRKHFLLTEVTGHADLDDSSSWWSEEDTDTPTDFHILCQAFVAALSLGPCVLLLDGINDVSAAPKLSQQEVKEFDWLPTTLPHHCRIIFSTARADLSYRCLCRRGDVKVITLTGVKDKSMKMSLLTKVLRPHVLPYVQKKQNSITDMRFTSWPLALCVLGMELNLPDVYKDLDQFVDTHYETSALRAYWTHCLQQWVTQHSWPKDEEASVVSKDDGLFDYTGWVADALCLLVVSRGGLLQNELLQLLRRLGYAGDLEVTVLHWLRFRLHACSILCEAPDGRIRFSHQHLQDMTEYTLLRSVSPSASTFSPNCQLPHYSNKRKVHQQLASFFAQQPLSWRQAQELPWHLMMCGDLHSLLSYITHSRVAQLFLARRSQYPDAAHDLQMYWSVLEKQKHDPGFHYISMLKDLGLYTLPAPLTPEEKTAEHGTVETWHRTNPGITITEQSDDTVTNDNAKLPNGTETDNIKFSTVNNTARNEDTKPTPTPKLSTSSRHGLPSNMSTGSGEISPRPKLSWGPHHSDSPRTSISGQQESGRQGLFREASDSSTSPRKLSQKGSMSPRRELTAETSSSKLADETDGDQMSGRKPLSSPCSYRLNSQFVAKKEASIKEPSSKTPFHTLARRRISSAPGKRTQKQSVVTRRPQTAVISTQQSAESTRPVPRPVSALAKSSNSQALATSKPKSDKPHQPRLSMASQGHRPGTSSGFLGFFLTADDMHFSCPDVLDGLEPDERKEILADLSSAVGWFLQRSGHLQPAFLIYSSLLSYLQASYPLSVATQILSVRVLERLGGLNEIQGDMDSARENYHQALRITFDLDALADDLCDHRQVDTFKGTLLGHHGYQHLAEGDVLEGGELLKEATESISHLTGNHALRASLLFHLGLYRGQLGELTRSEASLRQCLALRKQWHGQRHPEVAAVLLALARVVNILWRHKHTDQRQETELLYRKALAVSEQCLGSTHLQVAEILAELGELVAEEEPRITKMEACKLLQRSLDIRTTVLGADDARTKAARSSVRRVELSLQLGQADGLSTHPDHPQHISLMPQRDMKIPHMGSRAGYSSRIGSSRLKGDLGAMDIRSVSREKVLLHNRPDSILSSAMSLMTASERLLASRPVSSKGKASRLTSATSSAVGGRAGSMSVGWSAKSMPVEVRLDLDQEDQEGKQLDEDQGGPRPGTSTPRDAGTKTKGSTRSVVLDLDLGEVVRADDGKRYAIGEETDEVETPHLDSFAVHLHDGTIIIGEEPSRRKAKKAGKIRPQSTPHRLFNHYAAIAANGHTEKKQQGKTGRWEGQGRPTWSAHTTASSAAGSHVSKCFVPGPHDIVPANTKSLNGPHSDISSLLGPPVCPRENVYPHVHHKSAFYHVPGRYPTNAHNYPSRRCQKTEGARVLQTVLAAKMAQVNRYHPQFRGVSPSSSAAPHAIRVNQHDVSMFVRQTAGSRSESRGNAILASARDSGSEQDVAKQSVAPAVTFCEPISVS